MSVANENMINANRPKSLPLCEGWLDKFALNRSIFSSKGWHKRYFFMTHEGIGYCHSNPRDKGAGTPGVPLKRSVAKCFIPFTAKCRDGLQLLPVYYLHDLTAAKHPAVPYPCVNGITTDTASSEGSSTAKTTSTTATAATGSNTGKDSMLYYFAISFVESNKRYLLLLRTSLAQEYIKWMGYLPLYVSEGSARTIVPCSHPLEMTKQPPIDMNYRRLTNNKLDQPPGQFVFYRDPDAATEEEYSKSRRKCLVWNEEEQGRVVYGAIASVQRKSGANEETATEALTEDRDRSEAEYVQLVLDELDKCHTQTEDDCDTEAGLSGCGGGGGTVAGGGGTSTTISATNQNNNIINNNNSSGSFSGRVINTRKQSSGNGTNGSTGINRAPSRAAPLPPLHESANGVR